MPWFPARSLPDDLRRIALAALEYGLEVSFVDEDGSLQLWVGWSDLGVYQTMSDESQLDRFVAKWLRPHSTEA